MRSAALGALLAPGYLLVAVSLSVVADGPAGAAILALACGLVALGLGARARPAGVAMLAVDLLALAVIAHRVPWLGWGWILPRYAAVALGARAGVASGAVVRAVVIGVASLGALYVAECANVLWRSRGDPPRAVDTAVVLGFGLLRGGTLSPVFEARLARGVALHQTGLARRLLLTGGVGAHPPAESVAARARVVALGVPEGDILLEDRSHTTRENMLEARRVLREAGVPAGPVAVVSDTFHLARARRLAHDAGLDPVMVRAVSPAWTDRRRAAWWVLREAALLTLDDLRRAVTLPLRAGR
ncbi:MAG: YdcF family protein [Polyangiales bacterium]